MAIIIGTITPRKIPNATQRNGASLEAGLRSLESPAGAGAALTCPGEESSISFLGESSLRHFATGCRNEGTRLAGGTSVCVCVRVCVREEDMQWAQTIKEYEATTVIPSLHWFNPLPTIDDTCVNGYTPFFHEPVRIYAGVLLLGVNTLFLLRLHR